MVSAIISRQEQNWIVIKLEFGSAPSYDKIGLEGWKAVFSSPMYTSQAEQTIDSFWNINQ